MVRLLTLIITGAILLALAAFLRWGISTGQYWPFAAVIVGGMALAVVVADDEDRADVRRRWRRFTEFLHR